MGVHISVLKPESIEALAIRPEGIYIDATLGGGGHSEEIARRLTAGHLIGVDRDDTAITRAGERLQPWKDRVTLVRSDFRFLKSCLEQAGETAADGILFDLGVSSFQLDEAGRGFSYMQDAPLDMRMDRRQTLTASDVVNGWEECELRRILQVYGEERFAARIASAICQAREKAPIQTTGELSDLIRAAMPAAARREKQHPAKRSFQAIRIAVNDELTAVEQALREAIDCLAPGGRIAVISFHSLEDRIVKSTFAEAARGCECPPDFPVCVCGKKPRLKLLGKPIAPGAEECTANPRARSAKLRVAERTEF